MSVESARAFIRRLSEDKEFCDTIKGFSNPEDCLRAIRAAGYEFNRTDAEKVLPPGITLEQLTAPRQDSDEIPDALLDVVAGGGVLNNEDLELYFIFRKGLE